MIVVPQSLSHPGRLTGVFWILEARNQVQIVALLRYPKMGMWASSLLSLVHSPLTVLAPPLKKHRSNLLVRRFMLTCRHSIRGFTEGALT